MKFEYTKEECYELNFMMFSIIKFYGIGSCARWEFVMNQRIEFDDHYMFFDRENLIIKDLTYDTFNKILNRKFR